MSVRAIIVDDEPLARQRLRRLLSELEVDIVGEGCNGDEAIVLTNKNKADILFIDINMPVKNGIDAATEITLNIDSPPSIIFCTAYDEYALEAFNISATGYLLKPVNVDDLRLAIERAGSLNSLQLRALQGQSTSTSSLPVNIDGSLENIDIEHIQCFKSLDKHVYAVIKDRGDILVGYTLKELERKLESDFVRVHRNALVAVNFISKLIRDDKGASFIYVDDLPEAIQVSRRHLAAVKKCFR